MFVNYFISHNMMVGKYFKTVIGKKCLSFDVYKYNIDLIIIDQCFPNC